MSSNHLSNRSKTAEEAHLPSKPVTDRAYKVLDSWGLGRGLRSSAAIQKFPRAVWAAFWTVVSNEAVRLGHQLTEENIRYSFRNYYAAARIISNTWLKEEDRHGRKKLEQKTLIQNSEALASAEVRRMVDEVKIKPEVSKERFERMSEKISSRSELSPLEQAALEATTRGEITPDNPIFGTFARATQSARKKMENRERNR